MGWMAAGAGLLLGLALALLATFFVTKDERFDRGAEWSFVAFAVLAVPTILAVGGRLTGEAVVIAAITWIAVAGVAIVGLGELAITLRMVDFRRVSALITVGFLAYLAWIGAVSILVITSGGFPVGLGWLGIVAIAVGVAITGFMMRKPGVMSGEEMPERGALLSGIVPLVAIVAWMIWLGLSL